MKRSTSADKEEDKHEIFLYQNWSINHLPENKLLEWIVIFLHSWKYLEKSKLVYLDESVV